MLLSHFYVVLQTTVTLNNTGRNLEMTLDDHADSYVNVTGGPLAYQYRIQVIGYNSDLYYNRSQADTSSNGMFGIAVFIQIGEQTNDELNILLPHLDKVTYRGQKVRVNNFMIADILPYTDQYVTYEGSLTKPGCHESVTWIVYNKPIYASREFMDALRSLMVGSSAEDPKRSIGNNFRHLAPLNNRPIRTNIDFTYSV
ncbi:hypothetical protein HELRODRAFT_162052 [Helobdella robusta]|uniref:Alpha-carbonic anhydrase domain-containing protein n=1 Tax=Helobdella robusta TaxID=6412 RepID=T1ES70_HELRO|nr:hypothetical protein HELRODRAFT_162052 [Helobdella robusta]ESN98617.1 hypothetical protein HELRODRAFT_162052 [Helobdella robusta]